LFPGVPGFGISDPENQIVVNPVNEFIGFGGFGGGIKAAELEFLNLLHIETELDYVNNIESSAPKFNPNFKIL
jgi:hypothetical protein